MTQENELEVLREETRLLKALVAELLPLKEQLAQANARIKELEDRLAQDSRTSSKPPSSDGLARLPRSSRRSSDKRPGGQAGHRGSTLSLVELPDEVVSHRPSVCSQCHESLDEVAGTVIERRQVFDLPEMRLLAQEHQVQAIRCPACSTLTQGCFPASVAAPVQYGPRVQALAVYLHQGQLLPTARTCDTLAALCGCHLCEATLLQWSEVASQRLAPTIERIAELVAASPRQHGDETGIRIYGMLHWLHVNCTNDLTHLSWHASRGREAMEQIGIWPRFTGRAIHDRWASYDTYACAHSLCGAHLLRECAALAETDHEQQAWARQMQDFLLDVQDACQEWRRLHLTEVPPLERDEWVARYFEILASGYAAQPPPAPASSAQPKGRPKQSKAKNLLDALLHRAENVLAWLDDLRIPFTNNQAERDLRLAKVQQKISGTFRSATGATAFCRIRSYLSTMHKQGHSMLAALTAVFHGHPLPVAWRPE